MAITHVNTTTNVGAGVGALVITKPASIVNGDVLYAFLSHADDTPTVTLTTAPSGWTVVATKIGINTAVSNARLWIYRKVITNAAGEPANYSWTWDLTGSFCGGISAYRGVDNTTPEDVLPATSNNNPATVTSIECPSITTLSANALVVRIGIKDGDQGTIVGLTTQRADIAGTTTGDAGCRLAWADSIKATAGSTGIANWTITLNEADGFTMAIKEAVVAATSFNQAYFRGRNDDGTETTATWKAALNTNWSPRVDQAFRIRFLLQEESDLAEADLTFKLQYNKNSSGWLDVNSSSSNVRSTVSAIVADSSHTTQQLGAGTYVGSQNGFDSSDGVVGGSGMDFTAIVNQEVELEFCCRILSADTTRGDVIQLRIIKGDDTALATYTQTPSLTLPHGAGMTLSSASINKAVAGAENGGIFDFQKSLPWGAITLALRLGNGGSAFATTSKYSVLNGNVTNTDDTDIDGWTFNNNLQLNAITDISNVTVGGNLNIQTAGTYNFTDINVTGNVINNDAAGNVAINATNSVLVAANPGTGNGQVNIINTVQLIITCNNAATNLPIQGARVYIEAGSGGALPVGTEIMNMLTDSSGIAQVAFNYSANQPIVGRARKGTSSPYYKSAGLSGTINGTGFSTTIFMVADQ